MSAGYEDVEAQKKHVLATVLLRAKKPEKSEFWKVLFRWL
jgi:preprotein translocase subunit Sss1